MANKRTWAPQSYPIRDARDVAQEKGKIINPPRTLNMGGVGEAKTFDSTKPVVGTTMQKGAGPVSDRGKGGRR